MEADKLGDVCPACGMPRRVFEPYRERVSGNRLMLLNLDLHPISIHLSQTFVIGIPILTIMIKLFTGFHTEILNNVLVFSLFLFPFTLLLAIATGIFDGLTRFKTLKTPLLRTKIIFSLIILILSVALFFTARMEDTFFLTLVLGILCLATGVRLGLWGKKLINPILPGTYPQKRGSKEAQPKEVPAS